MPLLVKRFDLDYGRGDGLPLPPRNGGVGLRQGTGLQLQDKETCRPPSRPVRSWSTSSGARCGALPAAMACAVIMRVRCPGLPCEATGACRSLRTCLGRGRLWDPSVCDREDGNTERSTKTRLLGQTGTMLISCMSGYCSSSPGETGR